MEMITSFSIISSKQFKKKLKSNLHRCCFWNGDLKYSDYLKEKNNKMCGCFLFQQYNSFFIFNTKASTARRGWRKSFTNRFYAHPLLFSEYHAYSYPS